MSTVLQDFSVPRPADIPSPVVLKVNSPNPLTILSDIKQISKCTYGLISSNPVRLSVGDGLDQAIIATATTIDHAHVVTRGVTEYKETVS